MANLPSGPIRTPEQLQRRQRIQAKLALAIVDSDGDWRAACVELAKGDQKLAKKLRQRCREWIQEEYFQTLIGTYASGDLKLGIPSAVQALNRRAGRGNVPAIKLAMEASGFHNPRMEHHHSGKIEIELKGVPRPTIEEDHSEADGNVVDADVVED